MRHETVILRLHCLFRAVPTGDQFLFLAWGFRTNSHEEECGDDGHPAEDDEVGGDEPGADLDEEGRDQWRQPAPEWRRHLVSRVALEDAEGLDEVLHRRIAGWRRIRSL
jgi:hypothetical protein